MRKAGSYSCRVAPGPRSPHFFHFRINEIGIGLGKKQRVHDAVFSSIFGIEHCGESRLGELAQGKQIARIARCSGSVCMPLPPQPFIRRAFGPEQTFPTEPRKTTPVPIRLPRDLPSPRCAGRRACPGLDPGRREAPDEGCSSRCAKKRCNRPVPTTRPSSGRSPH